MSGLTPGAQSGPNALPAWRLSAYYFFYFAFIGVFSPYFSLYLASIHFSAWDIGIVMSVMQVMRMAAPYLWGWLAEHRGSTMPIVRIAGVASLLGFCGFFFTQAMTGVFVAMALMAFFWSAALPLVEALTLNYLGPQAGRYGRIRLWGSVGFIVAVLLTGALLDFAQPSVVLWMSLAMLVGIMLCALAVPERRHVMQHTSLRLRDVLKQTKVRALLVSCFFMASAHGALYVFYSLYLVAHGYSKTAVGILWTLGVLAEIVVFCVMPRILAKFNLRQILLFCCACAFVRFLVIGWCVEWWWLIAAAQLLHGATFGAWHASAVSAVSKFFPHSLHARGQALYGSISFGAGGMVGGLISGWVWEPYGAAVAYTLSAVCGLLAGLVLWLSYDAMPATAVSE